VRARGRIALKTAVWAACLAPLGMLAWQAHAGDLGANPIDHLTDTLGVWALRLLLASLAMTPLRILFGLSWPIGLRRLLGLFAFAYAALHFAVWALVDHYLNWGQMAGDIVKRPYITVGMLALLLLVPLAVTSTSGMVRRLGAARWRWLHRLAYVVAGLAVLHFMWLAKVGVHDPYAYLAILAALLGVRAVDAGRRLVRRRRAARAMPSGVGKFPVDRPRPTVYSVER
jgi:sulfoxide reductase heme-binding subunit YedZ